MENGIYVRVLDISALNIDYNDENLKPMIRMIKEIVFSILSWQAEDERINILQTQKEGIEKAKSKGVKFGRPKRMVNYKVFKEEYTKWKNGEQTAVLTMRKLGNWSRSYFYKVVKEYEQSLSA